MLTTSARLASAQRSNGRDLPSVDALSKNSTRNQMIALVLSGEPDDVYRVVVYFGCDSLQTAVQVVWIDGLIEDVEVEY